MLGIWLASPAFAIPAEEPCFEAVLPGEDPDAALETCRGMVCTKRSCRRACATPNNVHGTWTADCQSCCRDMGFRFSALTTCMSACSTGVPQGERGLMPCPCP